MISEPAPGVTVLVTGPPGAGKTTTALLWSTLRERSTFAFDIDLACSTLELGDSVRGQPAMDLDDRYALAARVIAAQVARSTASGVDCFVSAPRLPPRATQPESWRHVWVDLDDLGPFTIVLLPSPDDGVKRSLADVARRAWVREDGVRDTYRGGWELWRDERNAAVIDTSTMTPVEVVNAAETTLSELQEGVRA